MNQNPALALLVQLPIPRPGPQPIQDNVPLVATYLKLFARPRGLEGWQIDILPIRLCNRLGDRASVAAILDRRSQLAGFTGYLWTIQPTIWIIGQLNAAQPDIRILLGAHEIARELDAVKLAANGNRACPHQQAFRRVRRTCEEDMAAGDEGHDGPV